MSQRPTCTRSTTPRSNDQKVHPVRVADHQHQNADHLQRGLGLPLSPAAMTTPSLAAIERSPVIAMSRAKSSTTTHGAMRPMGTIHTSDAITMSLSASGSRNFPSTLTRPRLRAR